MEPKQADVSIPLQPSGWGAAPRDPRCDPQPRDYVLWSVFNVLLWSAVAGLGCLGFPALVCSIKARDSKSVGDMEAARRHGDRARVTNIVCSVVVTIALVSFIAAVIIISTMRIT